MLRLIKAPSTQGSPRDHSGNNWIPNAPRVGYLKISLHQINLRKLFSEGRLGG